MTSPVAPVLLTRVSLRFGTASKEVFDNLSAVAQAPDGSLWFGTDEGTMVGRLTATESLAFDDHRSFAVGDYLELPAEQDEIDIEGLQYADHYLWLTGSHSLKRKKPKGEDTADDLKRLEKVNDKAEKNRYLLARIPLVDGLLEKHCPHPDQPATRLTAASLERHDEKNLLMKSLGKDPHLGPFVAMPLPGKENGFDIEGLAVRGDRIFLGCRGPVLRGWSILLEVAVKEQAPGALTLEPIDREQRCHKKYFLDLNGLGVRDLALQGNDLLILAGPTMALNGAAQLFRLSNALGLGEERLIYQQPEQLELIGSLPVLGEAEKAEGLIVFPCLGRSDTVLVVYDSPDPRRRPTPEVALADVFVLGR